MYPFTHPPSECLCIYCTTGISRRQQGNKDLAKEDTNYTKKWYFFDCKYEIKNNQVFLMPMTGSDGTWMYGFVGFAAIAFTGCLYLLLDEKKKNKRKHRRKRR